MKKVIGTVTLKDSSTYDVRTCTKGQVVDSKPYASSKTGSKVYRVPGNITETWEISLYAKGDESDVPAGLRCGQIISTQLENGPQSRMVINSSSMEVGDELGELLGISLSCSAN